MRRQFVPLPSIIFIDEIPLAVFVWLFLFLEVGQLFHNL
ncbi:hypothetical protein CUZ91_0603 [Enterococcus xinjiangensis]|nr:hypothetical protein [Enterococcus lactis]MBL4999549.1 hypothetical protein [Enterococcus lactis]MBL5008231.1 hypothetical protein [Enterococcus lactis]MBL5014790.1 hypothetical protein [Enterococcus lactis]